MKRLDRLKQWAGEKMGGEIKTTLSDDFKSMEAEMQLRQDGMEKLHGSMNVYVKSMSKRKEADDREKMLPLDVLAHAMIAHGEEFESDSVFGNCLISMGQANEKIARIQDSYVSKASETWLESLERSLTQMKEYQAARKRLESRRLAYDATLTKMQKQKREDFRVEEELRAQRIKYEESNEDVLRRMTDIQESEAESVVELTAFLEAELEYHDRCREILYNIKRQWPAGHLSTRTTPARRVHSRTNTTLPQREESPPPPPQPERMPIRSRINSQDQQFRMQTPEPSDFQKPVLQRTHTTPASFDVPTPRRGYVAEPPPLPVNRSLRGTPQPTKPVVNTDVSSHGEYTQSGGDSPTGHYANESASQTTAHSGNRIPSRPPSRGNLGDRHNTGPRAPPPPPAPRSIGKKPPPPPPPAKRPTLAARE